MFSPQQIQFLYSNGQITEQQARAMSEMAQPTLQPAPNYLPQNGGLAQNITPAPAPQDAAVPYHAISADNFHNYIDFTSGGKVNHLNNRGG